MNSLRQSLLAVLATFTIAFPSLAQVRNYKEIKTPPLRKMKHKKCRTRKSGGNDC